MIVTAPWGEVDSDPTGCNSILALAAVVESVSIVFRQAVYQQAWQKKSEKALTA